jgi:hypothetical protein
MALALDADFGINDVDGVALADGLNRALRLARAAGNAVLSYCHCHSFVLLTIDVITIEVLKPDWIRLL